METNKNNKNFNQDVPEWQYDEMKLCGVQFDNEEFAEKYDEHHLKYRDYKREADYREGFFVTYLCEKNM